MEAFFKEFEETQLYRHLVDVAEADQVKMINDCINYCCPLLSYYTQTFPTYTLHNNTHQKNILNLISDLLGEKVKSLTSLETAMIILSTFFHDIGMVFKESELESIEEEETFREFLKEKYEARLNYELNGSRIDKVLAEWYCRWMHAKRVWIYIDQFETSETKLEWKGISIREKLGIICESHNHIASDLLNGKYETEFLGNNDLRFCAVLLRLADILDFDNSRTPKSVYEFLGLAKAENTLGLTSRIEWEKHLVSKGFSIGSGITEVTLKFSAGPKHPQVEKNISIFLDVIEDELRECSAVIKACSEKWRELKVNPSIDRKDIRSQGYKKGNYQLSLDERQIISLLTGENLYTSPFEFIRELLQNAIDTSRMREFHEQSNGNSNFKVTPIQLTSWIDADGYRWFRVDDFGMGMNENVIINHLLRKGNSYYKSAYFGLQKLLYKQKVGRSFTPISRFGIGLLSCFILGDKVEINTRSIKSEQSNDAEQKIRLSIDGLQNQYILQTEDEKHIPIAFPKNGTKPELGYRKSIGTSIAVRINRSKDYLHFEDKIKKSLNRFVTCSPVPIYYNQDRLGVDFDRLNHPFVEDKFYTFSTEQRLRIEGLFEQKISNDSGIEIITIDISRESGNTNLKGQLVFVRLVLDLPEKVTSDFINDLQFDRSTFLKFTKSYKDESGKSSEKSIQLDLSYALEALLSKCDPFLTYAEYGGKRYINSKINLIHNGINVPNYNIRYSTAENRLGFKKRIFTKKNFFGDLEYLCYGIIYLQDELIPDLSVSRNIVKAFGFSIYSSLYYATRKLNTYIQNDIFNYFDDHFEVFEHQTIASDYLVKNGYWDSIKLIFKDGQPKSIEELKNEVEKGVVKIHLNNYSTTFLSQLTRALLEINFDVVYDFSDVNKITFTLMSVAQTGININSGHVSLLFVPFIGLNIISYNDHINRNHPLAQWLLANQQQLKEEFLGYYSSLIELIMVAAIDRINKILIFFRQTIPGTAVPPNLSSDDYLPKDDRIPF